MVKKGTDNPVLLFVLLICTGGLLMIDEAVQFEYT